MSLLVLVERFWFIVVECRGVKPLESLPRGFRTSLAYKLCV